MVQFAHNADAPKDERYVYSASCSWSGPIAKAGRSGGLPGCPHCGAPLFEMSASEWQQSIETYALKAKDPDYPRFMEWTSTRGVCSPFRVNADYKLLREEFSKLQQKS